MLSAEGPALPLRAGSGRWLGGSSSPSTLADDRHASMDAGPDGATVVKMSTWDPSLFNVSRSGTEKKFQDQLGPRWF